MTLAIRQPPGVLGEIVARTSATLGAILPKTLPSRRHAEGPPRSLSAALRAPGMGLIAELKPRSPSAGPLRNLDQDITLDEMVAAYRPVASAVSVLVDGPAFGGSYTLLARARARLPQPILAKGFFLDPSQLDQAWAAGADAALLMASVLPPASLQVMLTRAKELGLECLVEAHDDQELDEVIASGAAIVGVNSRDLTTLAIDLPASRARLRRIPSGRVRVAESGLHSADDIDAVRDLADAVLMGTALMRATDPAGRLVELGFGASS